ncbi:flagellar FliL protein [Monaibacterium marinum]|uniref:Flagellar protein FliL n=1 Tax=Pontivivens marinum TaxID=1690039 RepID=A0A2C9CT62_9RHOB|nr:flagellar basal body-associated FliL family protein [Monaibacterium marinum]SOH94390.1 flagellar FliL protein [Monaibacterium marinum]
MSDATATQPDEPRKRFPTLIALVLCAIMGAGGFGFIALDPLHLLPESPLMQVEEHAPAPEDSIDAVFIAMEPQLISLGPNSRARHLRFSATLDVLPQYEAEIKAVKPRIADMIATYLRAVEPTMLEQPSALLTLRAQLLRRIAVIVGPQRVHDLLITEFILN